MRDPPEPVQLELDLTRGEEDGLSWHEWFMQLPPTPYPKESSDSPQRRTARDYPRRRPAVVDSGRSG